MKRITGHVTQRNNKWYGHRSGCYTTGIKCYCSESFRNKKSQNKHNHIQRNKQTHKAHTHHKEFAQRTIEDVAATTLHIAVVGNHLTLEHGVEQSHNIVEVTIEAIHIIYKCAHNQYIIQQRHPLANTRLVARQKYLLHRKSQDFRLYALHLILTNTLSTR